MASYRILRKLGEGGQGVVFEAEQVDLGRRVALKRLRRELRYDPSVVERFLREARMCAAIQHPNVVTIYETGQDDEGPFIAFELLEGESLETKVTREGPQPLASIGTVAEQILLALEEAHAKNLVHRDIKPANVFLSPRRRGLVTKLLDFGVAKGSRDYGSRLTMPGDVVGSLAFMAPEQINDAGVDARTDLYSVGVCLYFMLAGVRPFVGASTGELLLSLDRPPLPVVLRRPDTPTDLGAFVHRAMAREPAKRFPSATAMLEALAHLGIMRREAPSTSIEVAIVDDAPTAVTEPTLVRPALDRIRAQPPVAITLRSVDLDDVTIATRGDDDYDPFPDEELETHVRSPPRSTDPSGPGTETDPGSFTGPTHRLPR
ncbi:MAG: serine/threonine protein kinase [Myxococcales bacterium]|nr:serine/threonine protein kinase [Myxococcales bacterium]